MQYKYVRKVDINTGDITAKKVFINDINPSQSVDFHAFCDYIGVDEYDRSKPYINSRVVDIYNFFANVLPEGSKPEDIYAEMKTYMDMNNIPSITGNELVRRVSFHVRRDKVEEQRKEDVRKSEEQIIDIKNENKPAEETKQEENKEYVINE